MLKTIFICFAFFLSGLCATAQGLVDTPAVKLLQHIRQSTADTSRVKFLLALSKQLILKSGAGKLQIDSSYAFEKQAEQLSRRSNDLKTLGRSILMAALIENKKGDRKRGLELSQKAFSYFKRLNDLNDQAEALIIIGQHYELTPENVTQIIQCYKSAVAVFRQTNEKERLATTLVDLADYQEWNNDRLESLKNLTEALSIYKAIGYNRLIYLYSLMGLNLLLQEDPERALKYTLLSLRTATALKDTSLQMSSLYNRLAECNLALKNYKDAISYGEKALAIANKYRDTNYMYVNIKCMARIYYLSREPKKSIFYLDKVKTWYKPDGGEGSISHYSLYVKDYTDLKKYDIARKYLNMLPPYEKLNDRLANSVLETNLYYLLATKQYQAVYPLLRLNKRSAENGKILRGRAKNEYFWFKADSALGRYQDAIKHYQLSRQLSDSVFTLAKNKQVAVLRIEYETEQKEQHLALQAKSIALLKNNAQLADQKLSTRIYALIGILLVTMTILGLGYSRYRLKQRTNLQLEANQLEIKQANVSLQHLVTEKDWLLKEVHHRVKNNLQIVMSLLSSQSAYLENTAAIEAIRESQNRVQAISLIHQKLYKSSSVASISMPAYVADLLEYLADSFDIRKRNIWFEQVIEPFNLDLAQAVPIGLILNESITNAIKYAFDEKGGQILIALQLIKEETLLLTIADNGKGFLAGFDIKDASTLGMEMMKALSKQLGGELKVENKSGVRLSIEFQVEKILSGLSEISYNQLEK